MARDSRVAGWHVAAMQQFQTRRDDHSRTRIVEAASPPLGDGEARLRVESFAFTANNITYAVAGDRIGYWRFFPALDGSGGGDAEGWGVIPMWGFAEVVESAVPGLAVGARVFGYLPPATELVVRPDRVRPDSFVDASPHRADLPAAYNRYSLVEAAGPRAEAERMLLWPLHVTSWALWDSLRDDDWMGAAQVVLTSASSKTALGLAYALAEDAEAPTSIGLTSPSRTDAVTEFGLYDTVLGYGEEGGLARVPTVVVDMSGNTAVLDRIADHLGGNLVHIWRVGITHWDEAQGGSALVGERSRMFFAPGHIAKRIGDWGPERFARESEGFLARSAEQSRGWLKVERLDGLDALSDVFADVREGRRAATEGLVIDL